MQDVAKQPSSSPVTFRIPSEQKSRWQKAAGVRDGHNVSLLVRRAVDELIERENLIPETTSDERGAA